MWDARHLWLARAQPEDRVHRHDRGDHSRDHGRVRHRPEPLPGPLVGEPAHLLAHGHPGGRDGFQPADPVHRDGYRAWHSHHPDRAHPVLSVLRRGHRQGENRLPRPRLEEAAADLFVTPTQAFLRVTLPMVAPGIAAGALLAFSLSFDDYIITNFNASPSSVTFPMFVWGAAQRGTPVQINVIGTVMFMAALLLVAGGQLISNRRARAVV